MNHTKRYLIALTIAASALLGTACQPNPTCPPPMESCDPRPGEVC